jgi:hypothetical protein
LVYGLHRSFGLFGPLVLSAILALLITDILYRMLRSLSGRIAFAAAMTGAGVLAIGPMLYGRSTMLTIWFALLEIHLLHQAVVRGRRRCLLGVPFVIAAWANVHVQFVYGLFVYACFLGQALFEHWTGRGGLPVRAEERKLLRWLIAVGAASLLATLVNPYHARIYLPFLQYLGQSGTIYRLLQELQAPAFRTLDSWVVLAIVLAVVHALGRRPWRKPFLLLLFAVAVVIGFTSTRDVWFIVATGLPILASAYAKSGEAEPATESPALVTIGVLCATACAVASLGISSENLSMRLARNYPVQAAEHVEAHSYTGPLYNPYDWGGWLLWRWPEKKVSIDGRTYVHSTEYIEHSFRMWNAMPGWKDDPELAAAGVVLGRSDQPLMSVLASDARFLQVYRDAVASVFVRIRD